MNIDLILFTCVTSMVLLGIIIISVLIMDNRRK